MQSAVRDLPQCDLDISDESLRNLHPLLKDLASESPAWRVNLFGVPAVMFLSYELCAAAFRDEAALPVAPGYMLTSAPALGRFISTYGGEEHRVRRTIVSKPFRLRVVPRYVEMIEQAAADLVAEIAPLGEAELVSAFTRRLPLRVISNLLGLPPGNEDEMGKLAGDLLRFTWEPEVALAAKAKYIEMVTPLIEERRAHPGDDLISTVVHAEVEGEHLSDEEVHSFVRHLFPAGADTTYLGLGNIVMGLLRQPELLELARTHPEKRKAIVEEGLRWDSPVALLPRWSPPDRDIDWNGIHLPAGTPMIFGIMAANRDPAAFADPERFDPDRRFDNPPLTFGFGTHFCVGNHLAYAEIGIGLGALIDRLPDLHLQEGTDAEVVGTILRGPDVLPVRFSAN